MAGVAALASCASTGRRCELIVARCVGAAAASWQPPLRQWRAAKWPPGAAAGGGGHSGGAAPGVERWTERHGLLLAVGALAGSALAVAGAPAGATHCSDAGPGGDRSQIHSGHVSGIRFEGTALLKQLQDGGRGSREAQVLEILSASPAWAPFVPRFNGLVKDSEGHTWISMENLTAGMAKPVVMDLKVGTRHYSPGETEKKRQKELQKAATSTISSLGLRVVGCRVPGPTYELVDAEDWGYKPGRDPTAEELPAVLHRFLRTEARIQEAKRFASALLEHFEKQEEYVFFGSSLLLAYDTALGDAAPLRISMIDFGHAHTMAEMREEAAQEGRLGTFQPKDSGYIKGLTSLVEMLGR